MVSTLLAGVAAGVVATIVMTVFQMPAMRALGMTGPMPSAVFWSRLARRRPEEAALAGWVLHATYGVFWGLALALGVDAWVGLNTVGLGALLALGVGLGVVLWLVSNLFWMPSLGLAEGFGQLPREVRVRIATTFLVLHLIYGAAAAGTLWALRPVAPTVGRLGAAVPAGSLVVLAVVLVLGYAIRGGLLRPRRTEPARPA